LTEDEPDDSPEYFLAKAEWNAYWRRIKEGLQNGVHDDAAVAVARLMEQFGVHQIEAAVADYIENLGTSFERRWGAHREATLCEQEARNKRDRNPRGAGRKRKRSDVVLLGAWLVVNQTMRQNGLTTPKACELLVKAPSRREASRWPGLLLYRDSTAAEPQAGSYYIETAGNLRDVYNDAVARYNAGPETLRRHWQMLLDLLAPSPAVKSPPK
jgi:hypothetical protein